MLIYAHISKIEPNPYQRRQDYGNIEELAAQIAAAKAAYPDTYGIMQVPRGRIVCQTAAIEKEVVTAEKAVIKSMLNGRWEVPSDMPFYIELAFGHRRHKAVSYLVQQKAEGFDGWFPVLVGEMSDEQMLDAVHAENAQRKDITAVEEAELLAEKLAFIGNQKALAEAWGLARPTVTNRLRLLKLPENIQQLNRDGRLSERSALAILDVMELAEKIGRSQDKVKWGDGGYTWEIVSPDKAIAAWVEKPEGVKSEDVRGYYKKAQAKAGREISAVVADYDCLLGDVVQESCKGCPIRSNGYCLQPSCLAIKTEALQVEFLLEESETLGIPISVENEDFDWSYSENEGLAKTFAAGKRCPNMVIRFSDSWGGAWTDGSSGSSPGSMKSREAMRGYIQIGHVGEIRGCCWDSTDKDEADERPHAHLVPSRAKIEAWYQAAEVASKEAGEAVIDEVLYRLGETAVEALVLARFGVVSPQKKKAKTREVIGEITRSRYGQYTPLYLMLREMRGDYPSIVKLEWEQAEIQYWLREWWHYDHRSESSKKSVYKAILGCRDRAEQWPDLSAEIDVVILDAEWYCQQRGIDIGEWG